MIKLITFTDDRMTISAQKLVESAARFGCDETRIYTPDDLPDFWKRIQEPMLKDERGYGWWCWKPLIVLDAILNAPMGSYLIYCDAGNEIINNVNDIIGWMNTDVFLFGNSFKHVEWCKMDVLDAINHAKFNYIETMSGRIPDGLSSDLMNAEQVQASSLFFRVSPMSILFVKEWFAWSMMPGLCDNNPSLLPNVPTFSEHRHDQALICSTAIRWGLKLHWFPSQTGFHIKWMHPDDQYQATFNHHRKRNHEW